MKEIIHGDVVIVSTGQAGTYMDDSEQGAMVFLANGDIWYGLYSIMRRPQDDADLAACPENFDRFAQREKPKPQDKKKSRNKQTQWTDDFNDE
jgi:hypothetical protein